MLASACPGWVCYAEKTHGTFILPYISTAKSPQVSSMPLLSTLDMPACLCAPENPAVQTAPKYACATCQIYSLPQMLTLQLLCLWQTLCRQ